MCIFFLLKIYFFSWCIIWTAKLNTVAKKIGINVHKPATCGGGYRLKSVGEQVRICRLNISSIILTWRLIILVFYPLPSPSGRRMWIPRIEPWLVDWPAYDGIRPPPPGTVHSASCVKALHVSRRALESYALTECLSRVLSMKNKHRTMK